MNAVVTLNAFCCPGVGARNPVLTAARSENDSVTPPRTDTLPLVVEPKSLKFSNRAAVPTVQRPSASLGLDVAVERDVAAVPHAGVVSAR